MNPFIQLKKSTLLSAISLVLACFALSHTAQGVVPPPPGGYPNFTTAAGDHALQHLTLGLGNTAIGTFSLFSVTTGNFNTAVGAGSLDLNQADSNTATGAAALLFNTTGTENTANGTAALEFNTTGNENTATGAFALLLNTTGNFNTATGFDTLFSNTTGQFNTADGDGALDLSTVGNSNTAIGASALQANTEGDNNTGVGVLALSSNTTGNRNTVLGANAGGNIITANNVICIGADLAGDDVSDSCFINNIFLSTSVNGIGVLVNGSGKLGTTTSSRRFKEDIKPMDDASKTLFGLKPVSFHYKKNIDPAGTSQLGLVAEDVEKVNPDLVVRDKEGKPYSVRYDQVNAMLLNEFLKEHRKVESLENAMAEQQKENAAMRAMLNEQAAQIQRVSAQLELSKSVPQTVLNKQ